MRFLCGLNFNTSLWDAPTTTTSRSYPIHLLQSPFRFTFSSTSYSQLVQIVGCIFDRWCNSPWMHIIHHFSSFLNPCQCILFQLFPNLSSNMFKKPAASVSIPSNLKQRRKIENTQNNAIVKQINNVEHFAVVLFFILFPGSIQTDIPSNLPARNFVWGFPKLTNIGSAPPRLRSVMRLRKKCRPRFLICVVLGLIETIGEDGPNLFAWISNNWNVLAIFFVKVC